MSVNTLLDTVNHWFERVPDWMRARKKRMWLLFIASSLFLSIGLLGLNIDMSLEAFLDQEDPAKIAFDKFKVVFGSDENAYIVYKAKDGNVFSDQSIKALHLLQKELDDYKFTLKEGQVSGLDRVVDTKSLINVKHLDASNDTLFSRNFIGNQLPINEADREKLKTKAQAHPDYPLVYVSKNSVYGGIMMKTDFNAVPQDSDEISKPHAIKVFLEMVANILDGKHEQKEALKKEAKLKEKELSYLDEEDDQSEYSDETININNTSESTGSAQTDVEQLTTLSKTTIKFKKSELYDYIPTEKAIRSIIGQKKYTDVFEFYPVGNVFLMPFFADTIMSEMGLIMMAALALNALVLWLLFGSLSAVLWPMVVVVMSLLWVLGTIGLSGLSMSTMINLIVFLVLAVGIADSVHILSGYQFFVQKGFEHEQALREVFKKSALACFLTSITTAVGMITLILVPISAIKNFGLFAALGVFFAFAFTVFYLPLMLDIWNPAKRKHKSILGKIKTQLYKVPILNKFLSLYDQFNPNHPKSLKVGIAIVAYLIFVVIYNNVFPANVLKGMSLLNFASVLTIMFILFFIALSWDSKNIGKPKNKPKNKPKLPIIQRLLQRYEHLSYTYPKTIIAGFAIVGAVLIAGIFKIQVNSDMIKIIKEGVWVRDVYDIVDEHMSGTGSLELFIDSGADNALKDPQVLMALDEIQKYINTLDKVKKTASIVNITKNSYKSLNNDDENYYQIPKNSRVLDQTLFMFNNANAKDRKLVVSDDYSQGRIGVSVRNLGSIEGEIFVNKVSAYIDKTLASIKPKYPNFNITTTGQLSLMLQMTSYISWSQIKSFGLALIVISIILLGVFGSKRVGLLAVLPNLFPILTIFGLMGYLGIFLDVDTLLLAPIIIGLAVDDTIHFLTHYRIDVKKHGDIKRAINSSVREAGQAISFTTLILSSGFLMFIFSFHNGLANFGIFSAIAIFTALFSDLLLLPALLYQFKADFSKKTNKIGAI